MKKRTAITLQITALSSEGAGIGTLDGLKVFVEGALPEETVTVEIVEKKAKYAHANLLSIVTPSKDRISPVCPYFGTCGGCQLMHVSYETQLTLKQKRVQDALQRIAKLNITVSPCLASPLSLGYRNKIQLPVVWDCRQKKIGLYRKNTHEVIAIDRCRIQSEEGEEILKFVSERLKLESIRYILIRTALFTKEALIVLVTDGRFSKEIEAFGKSLLEHPMIKGVVENIHPYATNTILGKSFRKLAGASAIHEKLLDKTFKVSPTSFFQVNPLQTEHLYQRALDLAEMRSDCSVLDAYCGVGTLALFAASRARIVYGIECVKDAIVNAKENAQLNGISNAQFLCGETEKLIHRIGPVDRVFINPPRKGCAPEVIASLLKTQPEVIVYISCDPATLARDLALLSSAYEIAVVQPFDMFPQTAHVETVVQLKLLTNKIF